MIIQVSLSARHKHTTLFQGYILDREYIYFLM